MSVNNMEYGNRRLVIGGAVLAVSLLLIARLFFLQVINVDYPDNAKLKKTLYPARGAIYDRNGKLLVFNSPASDIVYIPMEVKNLDTAAFCTTLGISREYLRKKFEEVQASKGYSKHTIQTLMTQLTPAEHGEFEEKNYKFKGFYIQKRAVRKYNYNTAAQLLGYVAEVNKKQLDADPYYARGDYAGLSGIESSYETILRGEKGVEILLRDVNGAIKGRYNNGEDDREPMSGKDLTLSIDVELQQYAEYLMQGKKGSIVMIEPKTGEVLCMVSAPTYDPSLLLGREFSQNFNQLTLEPDLPLLNRAIQGTYPPGSTFKTTQGLIFLSENIITDKTVYPCYHGYPLGGGHPKCHGHASPLSIEPAIATSCNSFFCYGLNAMLNNRTKFKNTLTAFDRWKDDLVKMGFGYKLGVDLPSEKRGFIPNSEYYTKVKRTDKWVAQNVISIAIGQGEVLATPLQVANWAATLANRGYFYTPHVVKEVKDMPLDKKYTQKHDTGLSSDAYYHIVEGMRKAVIGGTCHAANVQGLDICGKTGTAQNPHGQDHSIFMGFAPKDDPKVAIFIIVENGKWGATFGVPMGRLMIEKYLLGEIPASDIDLENRMAKAKVQTRQTAWQ